MRLIDADELKKRAMYMDGDNVAIEGVEVVTVGMIDNAPTIEPCEDAVSREAVIAKAKDEAEGMDEPFKSNFAVLVEWLLDKLPPVTTKQRIGKWIDDKCSVCGKGIEDLISGPEWYRNEEPYFCPYCGIKLEGENE